VQLQKGFELQRAQKYDGAVAFFNRAAILLLNGQDWENYLKCANGKAEALACLSRIDSAEAGLRAALSLVAEHTAGQTLQFAQAYDFLAYFSSYRDRPDSAIAWNRWSMEIRRQMLGPDDPMLANNFYVLGQAHKKKGLYREAAEDFRESLRLSAPNGTATPFRANVLMLLGNVLRETAQYGEAEQYIDSSMVILRDGGLGHSHSMLSALLYMGSCLADRGCFTTALACYDSALALAREIYPDNQTVMVSILSKVGEVRAAMGDLDRALDAYRDALQRNEADRQGSVSGTGEIHQYIAAAFLEKGDTASARSHAAEALRLKSDALGQDHPDVAYAHEVLADIERGGANSSEALRHLQEAFRIRSLMPGRTGRPDMAALMLRVATLFQETGRTESADSAVRQAFAYAQGSSIKNPVLVSRAYELLAKIRTGLKRPSDAVALYDTAIATLYPELPGSMASLRSAPGDLARGKHLLRLLREKALCDEELAASGNRKQDHLQSALHSYLLASRTMLRLRQSYEAEGSKFRLMEQYADIFERGIRVALRLRDISGERKYLEPAFAFAEMNKAGALLDGIRGIRVMRFAGVPDSLIERDRYLRTQLTACEIQLARAREQTVFDSLKVSMLERAVISQREELWRAREDLRRSYPSYVRLFETDSLATIGQIQRVLDDSTMLVEYFLGTSEAFAFTIGKWSANATRIGPTSRITAAAECLLRAVKTTDRNGFLAASAGFSSRVLEPIRRTLASYPRLAIVSDRSLLEVPFELLLPAQASRTQGPIAWTALPFLVRSHEIIYPFSAQLYYEGRHTANPAVPPTIRFAGFAPVFRDTQTATLALASHPTPRGLDSTELRALTVDGKRLRELRYSENEVLGITEQFLKHGLEAQPFLHSSATKQAFQQIAPSCTYLHIATHGIVNENDPRRSALVFAQPPDTARAQDGILFAAEAYNLELNADLVVLSCCESGIGRYVTGEGVYALTRGFLYSGARNLVYSLWRVMDHHASAMMQSFYEGVLNGQRFSKALQVAKIKMLSQQATSFPFSWAGFVLVGE
jgi:CHAT domain-containing protein/tetratricopeptide (TPR) repeat protein